MAMWGVPALEVPEYREPRFGARRTGTRRETLPWERCKEALGHRVVTGIASRAHQPPHPEEFAALPEGNGTILRAVVRVEDNVRRAPVPGGHVQHVHQEVRVERVSQVPADDASTKGIQHYGEVHKTRYRRDVPDVGDPDLAPLSRTVEF